MPEKSGAFVIPDENGDNRQNELQTKKRMSLSPRAASPAPAPTVLEKLQHYAQRIRVPGGFLVAAAYLLTARPTPGPLAAGAAVGVIGVAIRAWASGHLRKDQVLTVRGVYRLTRNPLYLGSLLLGLGCALAGGSWMVAVGLLAVFFIVYIPVMRAEERHLTRIFPDAYPAYAARVPLFLPRLRGLVGALRDGFDPGLYRRHREYRAAAGLLAVFAFLILKMLWPRL
jgi:hypothetical protein